MKFKAGDKVIIGDKTHIPSPHMPSIFEVGKIGEDGYLEIITSISYMIHEDNLISEKEWHENSIKKIESERPKIGDSWILGEKE